MTVVGTPQGAEGPSRKRSHVHLLELAHVTATHLKGVHSLKVLDDVSLQVEPGELVAVYGRRKSGRTTLLRVAAGIEIPSSGTVQLCGADLNADRNGALGRQIGVVHNSFQSVASTQPALWHVAFAALARRVRIRSATRQAQVLLERVGAPADAVLGDLDARERTLVALARALAGEPRLLLVDEPTNGIDLMEWDSIAKLLRSVADDGIAVLATAPSIAATLGATRVLHLTDGKLVGSSDLTRSGDVVPIRQQRDEDLR